MRLKQPFKPVAPELKSYGYGIVAGVVNDSSATEVLACLYNLETASIYTDPHNAEAIYSFQLDEIDCCISM